MKALVLEKKGELSIRDMEFPERPGPGEVKIAVKSVGICGSDVHYYKNGRIGPFVVEKPMVLGHEAAGVVTETGEGVTTLKAGDRVCMEPGIPVPTSYASLRGFYNLDPDVKFWATPPVHGCLRESVTHPAQFTFKLPPDVSFDEGALVEPFSIGLYAADKAEIHPGDTAVVIGAGTIGIVTALAAFAAGCGKVIVSDIQNEKLDKIKSLGPFITVNAADNSLLEATQAETNGMGADIVFEASGSIRGAEEAMHYTGLHGKIVMIGMPSGPVKLDTVLAQTKEITILHIFRYAHIYPKAVELINSGRVDLKPLVSKRFSFSDSVEAFKYAAEGKPDNIKTIIYL